MKKNNTFLVKNKEKAEFNQYWFSQKTIDFLVNEVLKHGKTIAFISTPSVYFSLTDETLRKTSFLFEFDRKFEKDENFIFYDFAKPEDIPSKYFGFFDFVLIDPPFITKDVWTKYAEAILKIIKRDEENNIDGKILLSSISENEKMLEELLGVKPKLFKPCIPHLVYQYNFFSNYESEEINKINEEIGF